MLLLLCLYSFVINQVGDHRVAAQLLPGLPPLSANFQMYENANIPSDLAAFKYN
jgi:hypothetical protein